MWRKLRLLLLMAVVGLAWAGASTAWGALANVGEPIQPHGFPAYFTDSAGLQLEPCLPEPAGFATRPDLCVYDPLDPSSDLIVAGEIFWWMAGARINLPGGRRAELTLGIEGTFGGDEAPVDGQQISFGRTRIRIDTPMAGTYVVTHPYGIREFVVTAQNVGDGIDFTADIGGADFLDPARGFRGTLTAPLDPFLTWPGYAQNETLQVRDAADNVLEQYVGNPNTPSVVVGSPTGNNFFRVVGPPGSNLGGTGVDSVQTILFSVMGKMYDPNQERVAHTYPNVPAPKLFAMGPVNRVAPFVLGSTAQFTGQDFIYPVGYPLWYQENIGTIEDPAGGLMVTLCLPGDPMCISDPILNPGDEGYEEGMTALRTGGEGFWWSADAGVRNNLGRFELVLGLEATFGGDESIIDGQQITFGRERIRIEFENRDEPAATYRITHPYGVRILSSDPDNLRRIRFTSDIGIALPPMYVNGNPNPVEGDPDGAMIGALYSAIGPQLLKWTTFDPDPLLTDPRLVKPNAVDPALNDYFVGDPGILHQVTGSPFIPEGQTEPANYFRVEKLLSGSVENGQWATVAFTDEFNVSGKVFDWDTFQFAPPPDPEAPVAANDNVTLDMAQASLLTINVLANDTYVAPATVAVITGPPGGTTELNLDGTITYTPGAALADAGGVDSFTYSIVDATTLTSNIALVTITVIPAGAEVVAPVASPDSATLDMAEASSVTINVLGNDTYLTSATVAVVNPPSNGNAVANNPPGTITYTPNEQFAALGGTDTFTYEIVDATGLPSSPALVTVTVIPVVVPVEVIDVRQARLQLRQLRLTLMGTSSQPGSILTIYPDSSQVPLGEVLVPGNGNWRFRSTVTNNLTSVTIVNQETGASITQSLTVR